MKKSICIGIFLLLSIAGGAFLLGQDKGAEVMYSQEYDEVSGIITEIGSDGSEVLYQGKEIIVEFNLGFFNWNASFVEQELQEWGESLGLIYSGHLADLRIGYFDYQGDYLELEKIKQELEKSQEIEKVSWNILSKTEDQAVDIGYEWKRMWYLEEGPRIKQAWDYIDGLGRPLEKVVVAVIDSGVDYTHPDLEGSMWDGTSCKDYRGKSLGDCRHGYDFYGDDTDPMPESGTLGEDHGTNVAGVIAMTHDNNEGGFGIAPNVKIMALKVTGADVDGGTTLDGKQIQKAIAFATVNGADIINISAGDAVTSTCNTKFRPFYDILRKFYAYYPGLIVVSAGNTNTKLSKTGNIKYPTSFSYGTKCHDPVPNLVSVGAVDHKDKRAKFSNYGDIDLMAPGGGFVFAPKPKGNDGALYEGVSGTSISSPFAVGVAALIKGYQPTLSPQQLKATLISTSDQILGLKNITRTGRRINALSAVMSASQMEVPVKEKPGGESNVILPETKKEEIISQFSCEGVGSQIIFKNLKNKNGGALLDNNSYIIPPNLSVKYNNMRGQHFDFEETTMGIKRNEIIMSRNYRLIQSIATFHDRPKNIHWDSVKQDLYYNFGEDIRAQEPEYRVGSIEFYDGTTKIAVAYRKDGCMYLSDSLPLENKAPILSNLKPSEVGPEKVKTVDLPVSISGQLSVKENKANVSKIVVQPAEDVIFTRPESAKITAVSSDRKTKFTFVANEVINFEIKPKQKEKPKVITPKKKSVVLTKKVESCAEKKFKHGKIGHYNENVFYEHSITIKTKRWKIEELSATKNIKFVLKPGQTPIPGTAGVFTGLGSSAGKTVGDGYAIVRNGKIKQEYNNTGIRYHMTGISPRTVAHWTLKNSTADDLIESLLDNAVIKGAECPANYKAEILSADTYRISWWNLMDKPSILTGLQPTKNPKEYADPKYFDGALIPVTSKRFTYTGKSEDISTINKRIRWEIKK